MKLEKYISEWKPTKAEIKEQQDFDEAIVLIEKNCKKIMTFYKSQKEFLWRGVTSTKEPFIEMKWKATVRPPRNTDRTTHIRLNKLMKEKFGWPVRNGISVSTSLSQAMWYGTAYIFLPFDRYKFVYSSEFKDLFDHIKRQPIGLPDKEWEPKEMRSIKRLVNKHTDTNLAGAFVRDGEVLFKVGKYYLLHQGFEKTLRERWGI